MRWPTAFVQLKMKTITVATSAKKHSAAADNNPLSIKSIRFISDHPWTSMEWSGERDKRQLQEPGYFQAGVAVATRSGLPPSALERPHDNPALTTSLKCKGSQPRGVPRPAPAALFRGRSDCGGIGSSPHPVDQEIDHGR